MMRRWWMVLFAWLALIACAAGPAMAAGQAPAVHAFLDRTHVSLGDTVTLNIRSSGSLGTPDLAPLQKDFQLLGTSRSSSVEIVNGKRSGATQLGIALKPRHAGSITIPPLDVGGTQTQPLTLEVGAAPTGGTGTVGDPVFMQASVLSSSPYVGQQTVYTVRLYYLPGVNGALGDPTADGASLIKLDRDHAYTTDRNGYTYKVLERSWALIPQRSGSISVHGPEFQGERFGAGNLGAWLGNPNALLNNPNALLNGQLPGFGAQMRATAPAVTLDARAAPANGGKPWLPARAVQLKLTGLPANGRVDAGVPLTLTLSIEASGQPADALPEPELPPIAGARVYPDQTQDATDESGQWLQGHRTRSFAIVPERNGKLTLPAITLAWWNIATNRPELAELPAHVLQVTGVVAAASVTPPASAAGVVSTGVASAPAVPRPAAPAGALSEGNTPWRTLALGSLALWVLALLALGGWGWRRGAHRKANRDAAPGADTASATNPAAPNPGTEAAAPKVGARILQQRALDAARAGDAAACEHALLAWARQLRPGVTGMDPLLRALADPAQREALEALRRVRWRGGDPASACLAVAQAFARGFRWHDAGKPAGRRESGLPPLYPD